MNKQKLGEKKFKTVLAALGLIALLAVSLVLSVAAFGDSSINLGVYGGYGAHFGGNVTVAGVLNASSYIFPNGTELVNAVPQDYSWQDTWDSDVTELIPAQNFSWQAAWDDDVTTIIQNTEITTNIPNTYEYAYTIVQDGGSYKALFTNGTVAYSNANGDTLLNTVLAALPARTTPVTVNIACSFTKSTPIIVSSYTNIVSTTNATITNANSLAVGDTEVFDITGDYVTIKGITVDGNSANNLDATGGSGQGINFWVRGSHVTIQDCTSRNARVTGFEAVGYTTQLTDVWFIGDKSFNDAYNSYCFAYNITQSGARYCYSSGCGDIGLAVSKGDDNQLPTYIDFLGCKVENMNSTLGSSSTHYGARIEGGALSTIAYCTFTNVTIGVADNSQVLGNRNSVSYNTISLTEGNDWVGCGIQLERNNGLIAYNTILLASTGSQNGINLVGNYTRVIGNSIKTYGGASYQVGIYEYAQSGYNLYTLNDLTDSAGTDYDLQGTASNWTSNMGA